MKVTIAKLHLYPKEEPTGYAVGFSVEAKNGRGFYRDTVMPLEEVENFSDEEVASAAWNEMKEGIIAEVKRLEEKSSLLGKEFIVEEETTEEEETTKKEPETQS